MANSCKAIEFVSIVVSGFACIIYINVINLKFYFILDLIEGCNDRDN